MNVRALGKIDNLRKLARQMVVFPWWWNAKKNQKKYCFFLKKNLD